MYRVWGFLKDMSSHQGACMTVMSQGVRARSTDARSRRSHANCALSSRYGA